VTAESSSEQGTQVQNGGKMPNLYLPFSSFMCPSKESLSAKVV
jgi:hypothetical protein